MEINKISTIVQDFEILTKAINKTISSNWVFYSEENSIRDICEKGRIEVLIFNYYIILHWYKKEHSLKFEEFNKKVFSYLSNELNKFSVNNDVNFLNNLIISRFKYFKFNLEQDHWQDVEGKPFHGQTYYLFFKKPIKAKIIFNKDNYSCKIEGYNNDMCTLWLNEDQYSSMVMTDLHYYHNLIEELGLSWDSFTPPLLDFKIQENNLSINQKESQDNKREIVTTFEDFMNLGLFSKIQKKIMAESKILNHISFHSFVDFHETKNYHYSNKFPDKWLGRLPETIISGEMLEIVHVQTSFFQQYNVKFSQSDLEKFRVMMIKSILSTIHGHNMGY